MHQKPDPADTPGVTSVVPVDASHRQGMPITEPLAEVPNDTSRANRSDKVQVGSSRQQRDGDTLESEARRTSIVAPVFEESLTVGKRIVDQGGYRIVKKVNVREEVVDEPLASHTVHVERRAIGRLLPSLEAPASRQDGDTLIISIVEEVLVTEKRLMLKEELHITRTQTMTHYPQKFSLRSEDIAIERLEPGVPPAGESP